MSWRLARCLETLRDQVNALAPHRNKASDGTIGDAAHQARTSDHNPGADGVVEAIDFTHDPAGGFDSYKFAETLRLARDRRLEYVISNGRIFYAGGSKPWQWQTYTGPNPHSAHVHVSCQPDQPTYDNPAPWVIDRGAIAGTTPMAATVFVTKAPKIVADLMRDFGLSDFQAAGAVGNLGYESGGFELFQEVNPVGGGEGGYGWAQWTGPRRRAYFAWAAERGLDVKSDAANYGFLKHELQTTEATTIPALKRTTTLYDAMLTFETKFERAGVKRYERRMEYAEQALAAYRAHVLSSLHKEPSVNEPAPQTTQIIDTDELARKIAAAVAPAIANALVVALRNSGIALPAPEPQPEPKPEPKPEPPSVVTTPTGDGTPDIWAKVLGLVGLAASVWGQATGKMPVIGPDATTTGATVAGTSLLSMLGGVLNVFSPTLGGIFSAVRGAVRGINETRK